MRLHWNRCQSELDINAGNSDNRVSGLDEAFGREIAKYYAAYLEFISDDTRGEADIMQMLIKLEKR